MKINSSNHVKMLIWLANFENFVFFKVVFFVAHILGISSENSITEH